METSEYEIRDILDNLTYDGFTEEINEILEPITVDDIIWGD